VSGSEHMQDAQIPEGPRTATFSEGGGSDAVTGPVSATGTTMGRSLEPWGPGGATGLRVRGELVGRYVVLSLLGTGGMGAVYAAYDPELDRKVALKLLRPNAAAVDSVRLLREARALAKLAHPNVVSVFDVGTVGAEVFIAMEFIEGATVTRWLRQRKRSVREVLDLFLAAGRGLAAAHAAHLIHRDFKPDNMMVGGDGRVRVMDFGLARAVEPADVPVEDTLASDSQPVADVRLTREGTLLGTPAYMAPEQWQRGQIEAWTDQFAYCVALWEALFGRRPFRGGSLYTLMLSVTNGEIDAPSRRGSRVPAFLRRVLERGLSRAPEQRFPTMDALLAAIARGQARQRTGWVLVGLGTIGLVILMFLGVRTQRAAECDAHGAQIAEVWNDEAKAALRATLVATDVSYAGSTYEKAVPQIDRWTATWSVMRTRVCREAQIDGTRSPELYELSTACLDDRRDALAGLLEVLGDSTATDVQLVLPAIAGLEQVGPCAEQGLLERRPEPPSGGARQQVEALRRELMRVQGLLASGRYGQGLARAEALLASAEALGYRPLAIEARAMVGNLAAHAELLDHGEEALRRVYLEAGSGGVDELAARAAVQLVSTVGIGRARPAEGLLWSLPAEMLIRRLGQERGLLGASLFNNLAMVHSVQSAFEQALRFNEQALAIREEVLGPDHPEVATTLTNLAVVQRALGSYDAASASYGRALAIGEAALGPDHPSVATTLNNLGLLYLTQGLYGQSQSALARALAIRQTALGAQHIEVATTLNNLGYLHYIRGNYREAQDLLERALAIREAALGSDHREVATTLSNLGLLRLTLGDHEGARALFTRTFTIRERALTAGHPGMGSIYNNLGVLSHARGDHEDAQKMLAKALAIRKEKFGPKHLDVALSLHSLAAVRDAQGAGEEGLTLAREALTIAESVLGPEHPDVANFLNALALVQRSRDRDAARALAGRALDISSRTRGTQHTVTAVSLYLLGAVHLDRGELTEAQVRLAEALTIWETGLGPDVPEVADALVSLGEVELRRGAADIAVPLFERAVRIRRLRAGVRGHKLGLALFGLARALHDSPPGRGRDVDRARILAMEAAEAFRAAGAAAQGDLAAVESWVAR
jgi:tetratricopeptide (TPR) repeat protein/predicted Ser/Thr protein kinase